MSAFVFLIQRPHTTVQEVYELIMEAECPLTEIKKNFGIPPQPDEKKEKFNYRVLGRKNKKVANGTRHLFFFVSFLLTLSRQFPSHCAWLPAADLAPLRQDQSEHTDRLHAQADHSIPRTDQSRMRRLRKRM